MLCFRPFSAVAGDGFRSSQKLISIGHKHGNIDVNNILPDRTTVSRHLSTVVEIEKQIFCQGLQGITSYAITTDSWTEVKTNCHYTTATLHYLDNDWSMRSAVLATRETAEKQTGDNIRKFIHSILAEFNLPQSGAVYVTDNAANMNAAFRDEVWIGCAGHNLNLVLSHGL